MNYRGINDLTFYANQRFAYRTPIDSALRTMFVSLMHKIQGKSVSLNKFDGVWGILVDFYLILNSAIESS